MTLSAQFTNPILAGDNLARTAMQSPNFVTGSSGWWIGKNGNVEFNNGVFRGTITSSEVIVDGAGQGVFVYNGTPALGNLVASIVDANGTDAQGNAYLGGTTSYQMVSAGVWVAASLEDGRLIFFNATSEAGPWSSDSTISSNAAGLMTLLTSSLGVSIPFGPVSTIGLTLGTSSSTTWIPSSGDASGVTDLAAINAALTTGNVILLPGNFHVNDAIALNTGNSLVGAGGGATVIHQVSTAHSGISGTDVASITLKGFDLIGPSSGAHNGIDLIKSSANNIPFTNISDVRISHFGGDGLSIGTPIASTFTNVNSFLNSGNGFTLSDTSACTSCVFNGCYANANGAYGYSFTNLQYSSLNGCACDNNLNGYFLSGCHGVTLSGCGAEGTTTDSIIISNSKACNIHGAVIFNNAHYGIHVTGGSTRITVSGCEEISPAGGAANFLITDAGTSTVAWGIVHLTADSLGGTVTNVDGSA